MLKLNIARTMKQKVITLLLIVTSFSWLTTDCKAQKLTKINTSFAESWSGRSNWYLDINGDGKLERFDGSRWIDANGNTVKEIQGLHGDIFVTDDLNGDGLIDFVGWSTPICFYLSNGTEIYENIVTEIKKNNFESPYVVDINHDGLKDVFFYRKNKNSYTPSAIIQTKDHRFVYEELSVVTDEKVLEKLQFSTGGNGSYTVSSGVSSLSFLNGMFAKSREVFFDFSEVDSRRVSPLGEEEYSDIAVVDINNDGFPDIISTKYPTLLSLPDGRYYAGSLTGKVAIADINSDGLKDIVHFNTTTNTVTLYLSRDGGDFMEKKLIDNGSITGLYCQDFNGDGLTDIMLQAASESYSFIVFFINKGNGEFTKKENMLTGDYTFSKPYDFNNDGKSSVLAACFSDHRYRFNAQLKHLTWDNNLTVSENEVIYNENPLYSTGNWHYYTQSWDTPPFRVADFDGDGVLEVMCQNNTRYNYEYNYEYYIYSPFSPSANTAPQQMTTPNVVYDKQSGYVKVEWQQGCDKETASSALTYTVRMGTTDGGQDLMVYDAGGSRYCVANTGSWEKGTVYVSVRATDTNGKSGEWSASTSFKVETQSAKFTLHNKDLDAEYFTTADTLVVRSLNGKSLAYQLPDDGKIILQKGDSAYITFSNYGEKAITASLDGANQVTHTLTVLPIKTIYAEGDFPPVIADLDGDGISEALGSGYNTAQGLYVYDDNKYKKLPTLFNSDLTRMTCGIVLMDRTMNGLPDVYSNSSNGSAGILKNNTWYRWLINRGNLDFEVESMPLYGSSESSVYFDLNNDGFMDFFYYGNAYATYINNGDFTFEKQWLPYGIYADLNRDGLIDVIDGRTIYLNKGNAEFEKIKEITLADGEYSERMAVDVNNDGYPDYITKTGTFRDASNYQAYAYLGSKDMAYTERIALPGKPLKIDLDNNGYVDYLVAGESDHGDKGDYIFAMGEANGYTVMSYPSSSFGLSSSFLQSLLPDINNDGKPDIPSDDSNRGKILRSLFTNTAPTTPTSVVVTQDDDFVVVSWSGATDKETPNASLRYNLSVKEKGKTDVGSYIISPMNQTQNEAKTVDHGTMQYRYATRFPIPFSRFTVGKTYEVQVQTIDGWCGHSPFSSVVEFTPTAQTLLKMPEKAGEDQWVTFSLKDNSGETPVIDTDGGVMDGNTISWSTPGIKTVKVTLNGVTTSRQIQIIAYPHLSFYVPKKVLAGSVVNVELPTDFWRSDATVKLVGSSGVTCTVKDNKGIVVMPQRAGNYEVQIVSEDDVFGKVVYTNKVEVIDFKPEISRVSATSDGCLIQWDNEINSEVNEVLTGKVKIYRETAISGRYEVVGEENITNGQFADNTSHPNSKSCRYMITLPTVYGGESQESKVHGTVLLMANQGLGNDINLHWSKYEGAQVATYTIYAGTSRENLQVIDEVSGNTLSYIHHRMSDDPTYYAIGYTLMSELPNATSRATSAVQQARSNIICSDEAYNVTMVQNISIQTKESKKVLNEEQVSLHMQAIITPALATLARVEWSIIAGEEFAEISQDGTLSSTKSNKAGVVTVQARAIDGSDVTAKIDITTEAFLTKGDANGDMKVNVSDIVEIVNDILGKPSAKYNRNAADVNGDGQVNVTDIVNVVNIIMTSGSSASARRAASNNSLWLDGGTIRLRNAENYTAAQFDVNLSEGQSVGNIRLSSTSNHQLTWQMVDENICRVVVYSLSNAPFHTTDDVLFNITLNGSATISNELLIDAGGSVTAVERIQQDKPMDVYDLRGNEVRSKVTDLRGLAKGIYIINGKKVIHN